MKEEKTSNFYKNFNEQILFRDEIQIKEYISNCQKTIELHFYVKDHKTIQIYLEMDQ